MQRSLPSREPSLLLLREQLRGLVSQRCVVFAALMEQSCSSLREIVQAIQAKLTAHTQSCEVFGSETGWIIGRYRPSGDDESILMSVAGFVWRRHHVELYFTYAYPDSYAERFDVMWDDLITSAHASAAMRYTRPLPSTIFRRRKGIQMFRDAVNFGWLGAHLQPIAKAQTLDVVGWEMLARITHLWADLDSSTAQWIPYVLNGHDSYALFLQMLDRAKALSTQIDDAYLSVNVTGKDMASPDLVSDLTSDMPAEGSLMLELTEWEDVLNIHGIHEKIQAIRAAGFRIALDDFGAMHSSIRVLREIRFDAVKLDMHLLRSRHPLDVRLLEGVVGYCKEEGIPVIAEGIEEPWILARAREIGVEYVQGFFVDRSVNREPPFDIMPEKSGLMC